MMNRPTRFRGASIVVLVLTACGGDTGPSTGPSQNRSGQLAVDPVLQECGPQLTADGLHVRRRLVRGAAFAEASALTFHKGLLYVASMEGSSVSKVDPWTGKILGQLGRAEGIDNGPGNLAFGPDGSLYWTEMISGDVGRRTPDGTSSVVANTGMGANGITFSPSGRLFYSQTILADALYEVDVTGVNPPRLIAENLGSLKGITYGPDGFIYGASYSTGTVSRVNVDTGEITQVTDGLVAPVSVQFNSKKQLYVADVYTGLVFRVDVQTGAKTLFASVRPGIDGIAFDSKDHMFFSSSQEGYLGEIGPNNAIRFLTKPGLTQPMGLAALPGAGGEDVVVADFNNLRRYNASTGKEVNFTCLPIGMFPTVDTASINNGKLLTISFYFDMVTVWDVASMSILENYTVTWPFASLYMGDDIVVAKIDDGTVVRKQAGSQTFEVIASGFYLPTGLAADANQNLYVTDWYSGLIMKIIANGQILNPPEIVTGGLNQPEGMAVDSDGTIVVAETGADRVVRVDPATGSITLIDNVQLNVPGTFTDLPAYPVSEVAIGKCGTIYVSDAKTRDLLSLVPTTPAAQQCFGQ